MDLVARFSASDRAALFTETAARAGLTNPVIAEKDFWVCWTLNRLYALPDVPRLLFKGGTSLSKCFGLIKRFSEDIDLGLHREDLRLGVDADPATEESRNAQGKARENLINGVRAYVTNTFAPKIEDNFTNALAEPFTLVVDETSSESVVRFAYPRALDDAAYGGAQIRPAVILEIGARSDHHPIERVSIRSYAAEHFPTEFAKASCEVIAQAAERTLLEKALILHSGIARKRLGRNVSRHAYDLTRLYRHPATMMKVTRALFEEVARHKRVFGDDQQAGRAPTEGIRLVPDGEQRSELEADYKRMQEMFFEEPPSFAEIVEDLRKLELDLNDL